MMTLRYEDLSLVKVSLATGVVLAAAAVPLLGAPARVREWAVRFPRNAWAARILTAADVVWAAWLLMDMPMGRFDAYKRLLYILAPATYWLVVKYMDELLAARVLGGLLMLLAAPMLAAARWHPSGGRLLIVAIAYASAIIGVAFMMAPYRLRRWASRLAQSDGRCRVLGSVIGALGLACIILALTAF